MDSCYGFKLATTQPTITCSKLTKKNTRTRCEICLKLTIYC